MKDWLNIMIVSPKQNLLCRLRLPWLLIGSCLAVFVIMAAATIGLIVFNQAQGSVNINQLEYDNTELLKKLDSLGETLKATGDKVNTQISQDNRERTFWQMACINPDVWSMGIGGKTYEPASQFLANQTGNLLDGIYEAADILKGKCDLRSKSLSEIQNQIENNLFLWAHIPATNPLPGHLLGSGFGFRNDPIDHTWRMHTGVDIGAPRNTPIHASGDGLVSFAGWDGGYGWMIEIEHGYGFKTRYGHCTRILVNEGDRVKRDQVIGTVGSTGRATSPHCHYEVHVSGVKVNPRKYIDISSFIVD